MKFCVKVILCVVVVNLLGGAGALITSSKIPTWYASLEKPPGVPPNWIFGPVWTTLYTMIGISIARYWHFVQSGEEKNQGWLWMVIQMVLNLAWTPIFFGANWLGVALIVIVGMIVTIAGTIRKFYPQEKIAAFLLVPYLTWVCYATYLNTGYWWLNR